MSTEEEKVPKEPVEQAPEASENETPTPEPENPAPEKPEGGQEAAEDTEAAQDTPEPETAPESDSDAAEEESGEPEEDTSKEKGLETPDDPEDAARLGVKETIENSEAMAIAKKDAEKAGDAPAAAPSFFVDTKKRHRVEVDILCSKTDGQVLSVSRTGLGIEYKEFAYLTHVKEWFEFTLPGYEDMSSYRQRCGVYRPAAQQVLIDRLQLRNFMLVWHLKDWSLRDAKEEPVKLEHDENGSLSDDSLAMVYKTHTTILDVVLTIFEKDILLT